MELEWRNKAFSFFNNSRCEWFPCHQTDNPDDFNCLFCYCPLYVLGNKCGGSFSYTKNEVKDCSGCKLPHIKDNYGYVISKFFEINTMIKEHRGS